MIHPQWRLIGAGVIGNVIEYYDFALIGFLAVMMGDLFFPSEDPMLSLLGSFGAFAAGMIMRPVGAVVFGHMGDRIGRKYALMSSLIMMALPTFLIGLLPTYAQIGVMAPIALVLLRMVQGFSVGGEYASSIVYLVEQAPPHRQNFYGSFVSMGAKMGMALGSALCGGLLAWLGEESMREWGWRIPFLVSVIIAMGGLYLRRELGESYTPPHEARIPIVAIAQEHRREFGRFVVIASVIWLFYYTLFIYLPVWMDKIIHVEKLTASYLNTFSIVVGVIFIPIMAWVADHIGSMRVMRLAAIATAVLIYPLFVLLSSAVVWQMVIAVAVMAILVCAFQAPIFAATVNAIDHRSYRASFTAVILGSAAGVVGGSTPALMSTLSTLSPLAPAYVIVVVSLIAWLILLRSE